MRVYKKSVEFLGQIAGGPIAGRLALKIADEPADAKYIDIAEIEEIAYLVEAAKVYGHQASGYVKGACSSLRWDGLNLLRDELVDRIASTEIWKRNEKSLIACFDKERDPVTSAFEGATPLELSFTVLLQSPRGEIENLQRLVGLSDYELLAELLLAPAEKSSS